MELKGRIGMVFEKVRELLADQLEIDPMEIDMDTDILDDLGADSLDVVELVMSLEEEFGIVITDEHAGELRTVRQLVDFVEKLI
jgi:acyl carrier protein